MLRTKFHFLSRYTSLPLRFYSSPNNSLLYASIQDTSLNYLDDPSWKSHLQQQCNIDESHILNQLSDILPIRDNRSIQKSLTVNSDDKELKTRAVDGFLQPEEKLRGIFLQKLSGKNAVDCALTSVGVELTVDIFARVVNRGSLGGDAMVNFFNWAVEQPKIPKDRDIYHVILKALGRRKYFEHMVNMFLDMRKQGISAKSDTLFIVTDSFIRARQVSKAIQMFYNLEDYGLKCSTEMFNVLLRCLTRRSHVGTATSLLNKMKGKVQFDSMTYNLIIGGWSKFGRVSEVEKNLKSMVEDGLDPDSLTYSYIVEGLGRSGKIDEAAVIFRRLEKEFVLNVEVYNAMISNFISVGDVDKSLKYYKQMLSTDCEPDMHTYIRLISAFLKARKVADAIELFDEMLDGGIIPTTGAVTSFIEPLCEYGPPHAALMIYQKARKVGCKISLTAYKLLLMRLSSFGKCGMMLNVWNEMQESGYPSDAQVYEYIINGLCNIGQLENAVQVMEELLQKGFCPSRLICSKLNNKLLASNKVHMAYKLFLKIKIARRYENARTYWRAKGWHF